MNDTPRSNGQAARTLVTGATGMIGRLLVDELLSRGAAFSVMVRPASDASSFEGRQGVDVVRGDLNDPASLEQVLGGVERAFLLTNSTDRTEQQQLAFVDAAHHAGVKHIVKLSQLHASADSSVRFLRYHAAVEEAIRAAGIDYTFVRPNLVLQAYLPFAASIAAGQLQAPIGDARVSVVDARDIADVAAIALTEDGHNNRTYDVTGPRAVTHAEIADAFAHALGHPVVFERVSSDAFVEAVAASGTPLWQAEGLAEDYEHYERHEAEEVSTDVETVTGHLPRSVTTFVTDYADRFRST